MEDLIKALTIFMKYLEDKNEHNPTHCEHDELWIMTVDPADVSPEDHAELERLGFDSFSDDDGYMSYRFGSA